MTQKEKLIALLDEMGVGWDMDSHGSIIIESGDGPKNKGYSGFYVDFFFDPEESLESVGIWE